LDKIFQKQLAELGLTQKSFSEEAGLGLRTVQRYAAGDVPKLVKKYIELRLWMKRRSFKIVDF